MWTNLKRVALLAAFGISQTGAQLSDLLPNPEILWVNQIIPSNPTNSPGVLKGNGVFLTPDGMHLISTSVGGTVTSFGAANGEFEWEYDPPAADGVTARTHSGITFTTEAAAEPYMVYSVVDNENSLDALTRVVALDMNGNELWISPMMPGIPAGSPVVSNDGEYVFLTHNANFESVGYFSTLWAGPGNGTLFYSRSNETSAFGAVGIFHNPSEGYYDGDNGLNNRNDMIMWCQQPKPDDQSIGAGAMFGFQFPVGFTGDAADFEYFQLGDEPRDFQSGRPPVMANEGRSAYWAISRSAFWAWVGEGTNGRGKFNRGPTGNVGFTRNDAFAGQAPFATPALSSDSAAPFVFGGSAHLEFIRLNFDYTQQVVVATESHIMASAIVDPEDRAVYYVESNGMVHQVNFDSIGDIWTYTLGFGVEGEIALHPNGRALYIADTRGLITALQVAEIPQTTAPSVFPTDIASESPSKAPAVPTESPTSSPTGSTPAPMEGPTPPPIDAPTRAPADGVDPPTDDPPTAAPSDAARPLSLMALMVAAAMMLL